MDANSNSWSFTSLWKIINFSSIVIKSIFSFKKYTVRILMRFLDVDVLNWLNFITYSDLHFFWKSETQIFKWSFFLILKLLSNTDNYWLLSLSDWWQNITSLKKKLDLIKLQPFGCRSCWHVNFDMSPKFIYQTIKLPILAKELWVIIRFFKYRNSSLSSMHPGKDGRCASRRDAGDDYFKWNFINVNLNLIN